MKSLIDANVALRNMLNDHQEMTEKAKIAIQSGVFTTPEVLSVRSAASMEEVLKKTRIK